MDDALSPFLVFRRKERPSVIVDGFSTIAEQDLELMRRWEEKQSDVKVKRESLDEDDNDLLDFDEKMPSNQGACSNVGTPLEQLC